MAAKLYKAKTLSGAQARVRQLDKIVHKIDEALGRHMRRSEAAELILAAVQIGAAAFYLPTGELRFNGLMYSAKDRDWRRLVQHIGREQLVKAARACGADV